MPGRLLPLLVGALSCFGARAISDELLELSARLPRTFSQLAEARGSARELVEREAGTPDDLVPAPHHYSYSYSYDLADEIIRTDDEAPDKIVQGSMDFEGMSVTEAEANRDVFEVAILTAAGLTPDEATVSLTFSESTEGQRRLRARQLVAELRARRLGAHQEAKAARLSLRRLDEAGAQPVLQVLYIIIVKASSAGVVTESLTAVTTDAMTTQLQTAATSLGKSDAFAGVQFTYISAPEVEVLVPTAPPSLSPTAQPPQSSSSKKNKKDGLDDAVLATIVVAAVLVVVTVAATLYFFHMNREAKAANKVEPDDGAQARGTASLLARPFKKQPKQVSPLPLVNKDDKHDRV